MTGFGSSWIRRSVMRARRVVAGAPLRNEVGIAISPHGSERSVGIARDGSAMPCDRDQWRRHGVDER